MSPSGRHERVALNESRFRDINDKLRKDMAQLRMPPDRIRFVCECGNFDCRDHVDMELSDYERVRAGSRDFFVVPGHEIEDAEDVVDRHDDFNVVRKHDDVADLVEKTDPRR